MSKFTARKASEEDYNFAVKGNYYGSTARTVEGAGRGRAAELWGSEEVTNRKRVYEEAPG